MRHSRFVIMVAVLISIALAGSVTAQEPKSIDADKALSLLKEGNARFVEMDLRHLNQNQWIREETAAEGQKPFAVILACSDSRVPVEIIFDHGIGDIFVVRVAGNVVMDASVIGSIEYAAQTLKTPLLVVLGHNECGAVKAGISGDPTSGGVRDIQKKIEPIATGVKTAQPELTGHALPDVVVRANAIQAKEDILSQSAGLSRMVKEGKLKAMVAIYDLRPGKVEWLGE